jgi:hypothetical protein
MSFLFVGRTENSFQVLLSVRVVDTNGTTAHASFCLKVALPGCMDVHAVNYNPAANVHIAADCQEKHFGCTDAQAVNYNAIANIDDGSCNRDLCALQLDDCGSHTFCNHTGPSTYNCTCMDGYVPSYNITNACELLVQGCGEPDALNYNPLANVHQNEICQPRLRGCMHTAATNFNITANTEDQSCEFDPCSMVGDTVYGGVDVHVNDCHMNASCHTSNSGTIIANGPGQILDFTCECHSRFIAAPADDTGRYTGLSHLYGRSCTPRVPGCMEVLALNYNSLASINTGCQYAVDVFTCPIQVATIRGDLPRKSMVPPSVSDLAVQPRVYAQNNETCARRCLDVPSCTFFDYESTQSRCSLGFSALRFIQHVPGCMDSRAENYNSQADLDDGSCILDSCRWGHSIGIGCSPRATCINVEWRNRYLRHSQWSRTNCTCVAGTIDVYGNGTRCDDAPPTPIYGCTDSRAINYNQRANIDNSSCAIDSCQWSHSNDMVVQCSSNATCHHLGWHNLTKHVHNNSLWSDYNCTCFVGLLDVRGDGAVCMKNDGTCIAQNPANISCGQPVEGNVTCPNATDTCVFTATVRACNATYLANQSFCSAQLSRDDDGAACVDASNCTYHVQGNCGVSDQSECDAALQADIDGTRCRELKCIYSASSSVADGIDPAFLEQPCLSNPCVHEGVCSEVNSTSSAASAAGALTYNCSCPPEWTGSQCEIFADGCASNPCLHGGTCISRFFDPALPAGGYRCVCNRYFPNSLDYNCAVYQDECSIAPCKNGATCISSFNDPDIQPGGGSGGGNGYLCVCTKDWSDNNCTSRVILKGCTDSRAINFDSIANTEDGSCMLSVCDWQEPGRVSSCHSDALCTVPELVNASKWQDYVCTCKDGYVDMANDGTLCLPEFHTYFGRVSFESSSTSFYHNYSETCDSFTVTGIVAPYQHINGMYIRTPTAIASRPHYRHVERGSNSTNARGPQYNIYYTDGQWILDADTDSSSYIGRHVGSTRFVTTPCQDTNVTEHTVCTITSRGRCEFTQIMIQRVESLVKSPHTIQFDADQFGEILDGGEGLYDGGNRITTSLCPYVQLKPYVNAFQSTQSNCFGTGGSYRMNKGTSTFMMETVNTHSADIDIFVKGNLGADGVGMSFSWEFEM